MWASDTARAVRREVFTTFASEGRAPSTGELAARLGIDRDSTAAALRELHDAHAIVLTREGDAIRMAHPFSAWPMNFVLRDGDRLWWGGCAWDSFGIVAALGEELEILTVCPGCGTDLRYTASPTTPPRLLNAVVRIPRPAAEWWDDVVATCTAIRTYCSADHVRAWSQRTGEPESGVVELERLWRLALSWYGDRLDPEWEPQTPAQRQSQLEANGLTGPFWRLP